MLLSALRDATVTVTAISAKHWTLTRALGVGLAKRTRLATIRQDQVTMTGSRVGEPGRGVAATPTLTPAAVQQVTRTKPRAALLGARSGHDQMSAHAIPRPRRPHVSVASEGSMS